MASDDPRVTLGQALAAARLGTGPRLVALALWTFADYETGAGARPSTTKLAAIVGRAARDVRRFLRELERAQIVEGEPAPGKATTYRFLIHSQGDRDPGSQGPRVTGTPGEGDPDTPGPCDPPPRVPVTPQTPEPHEPHNSTREPRSSTAPDLARTIMLLLTPKLPEHVHLDPAEVQRQAARLDALGWTAPALAVALGDVDLSRARSSPAGLAVTILRGMSAPPRPPVVSIPTPAARCEHGKPYGWDGTSGCAHCPDRDPTALAAARAS